MKLLVTSDWHMDAVTAGKPRLDEIEEYFEKVRQYTMNTRVDLLLVLGDMFDPGGMKAHKLTSRLISMAKELTCCSVWIAGNHDVIETSEGWTTLSPLKAAMNGSERVAVAEMPAAIMLGGVAVLALPYVARAVESERYWEALKKAMSDVRVPGMPIVVAGHMTVPGARMGSETHEMARGRDLDLPVDRWLVEGLEPVLVVNGHYHVPQTVRFCGREVHIPGAPMRMTFGEADECPRGFLIAEV